MEYISYLIPVFAVDCTKRRWTGILLLTRRLSTKNHIESCGGMYKWLYQYRFLKWRMRPRGKSGLIIPRLRVYTYYFTALRLLKTPSEEV